jgi:3-methyladenine DNA glycosylase AlkD
LATGNLISASVDNAVSDGVSNRKHSMTAAEIIAKIKPLGLESYKKVILKHGVQEPCFGVKIEELKKIQKQIKQDYRLALELYDTGIFDAMYLAGLIADDKRMTKADLNRWLKGAKQKA